MVVNSVVTNSLLKNIENHITAGHEGKGRFQCQTCKASFGSRKGFNE